MILFIISASLVLSAGVHPKIVSEMLGHSSVALTMDTYSHVIGGLQEAAMRRLYDMLQAGTRAENGADSKNIGFEWSQRSESN